MPQFAVAFVVCGAYMACAVWAVHRMSRARSPHLLPLDARTVTPPATSVPVLGLVVLAACLGILALGGQLLEILLPLLEPGSACRTRWLASTTCDLSHTEQGFSIPPSLICAAASVALVAMRAAATKRAWYPMGQLAITTIAVAALIDWVMVDWVIGSNSKARPEILFAAATGLKVTAGATAAAVLLVAKLIGPRAVFRSIAKFTAVVGFHLLGLLMLAAVWNYLPAASAVALMILTFLVPGLAACATLLGMGKAGGSLKKIE